MACCEIKDVRLIQDSSKDMVILLYTLSKHWGGFPMCHGNSESLGLDVDGLELLLLRKEEPLPFWSHTFL